MNRNWYCCKNEELLKEMEEKEDLYRRIAERVMRCPHCKTGHFFLETSDEEYSSESWWMCDNCWDSYPSKLREKMINEIVRCGDDEYWDAELWHYVYSFKIGLTSDEDILEQFEKVRDFDPDEWNREKHYGRIDWENPSKERELLVWENLVEDTIREHIKALDKAIERAKKYKMLKKFFKE